MVEHHVSHAPIVPLVLVDDDRISVGTPRDTVVDDGEADERRIEPDYALLRHARDKIDDNDGRPHLYY
jgi:hypothetical protein